MSLDESERPQVMHNIEKVSKHLGQSGGRTNGRPKTV